MQEESIKTNLLSTIDEDSIQIYAGERTTQFNTPKSQNNEFVKPKKRMTSKQPISKQQKFTLDRIFNISFPIQKNNCLRDQCQLQVGNLFIGGSGVLTKENLQKYNIKAILSIIDYKTFNKLNIAEFIQNSATVQHHQFIDLDEDQIGIQKQLEHSYHFIDNILSSNFNLLVHSKDGLSRAPLIVVSYLMKKYGLTFDDAQLIVKLVIYLCNKLQATNIIVEFEGELNRKLQQILNDIPF